MSIEEAKHKATIYWSSTSTERYDTDMLKNARDFLETEGVEVLGEFGGTFLPTMTSDNGFEVKIYPTKGFDLIERLGKLIDKEGVITLTFDDDSDESSASDSDS